MEITYLAFLFDMEPLISHWLPILGVFLAPQLPHFLPPSISILTREIQALGRGRWGGGLEVWGDPLMGLAKRTWFWSLFSDQLSCELNMDGLQVIGAPRLT